jgi:tetratricopeptide (TPR) repeat protein
MASIEKLFTKAISLWQANDLIEARENFKKIIEKKPNHIEALTYLGIISLQLGFFEDGLVFLSKAINFSPHDENIKNNLSNGYVNFANSLINNSQPKKALDCLKKAIDINKKNEVAWINFIKICSELKEYELAEEYLKKINIKNYEIFYRFGNILFDQKRYSEAIDYYFESLNLKSDYPECFFHIGLSYLCMNKKNDALKFYDRALGLRPDYSLVLFNKAQLCLSMDNFEEGWKLYKYRWNTKKFQNYPKINLPYLGSLEKSKKILIRGEQGIGDQIFYSSMLVDFAENINRNLTVSIDNRLLPLFNRSFSHLNFVSEKDLIDEKDFDYQLPIGDLGFFVRRNIEDFKRQKTFLFSNDKKTNNFKKIFINNRKKSIGLSWTSTNNDLLDKSIKLSQLKDIFLELDYQYVNLEYVNSKIEIKDAQDKYGISFFDTDDIDKFNDLDSLASLISSCDYIITISNVTAHFAGALGAQTFLLVPYGLGQMWYWSDDYHSKWYPSLKIFKQKTPYDWSSTVNLLKEELIKLKDE